jgi:hypothetical protein
MLLIFYIHVLKGGYTYAHYVSAVEGVPLKIGIWFYIHIFPPLILGCVLKVSAVC